MSKDKRRWIQKIVRAICEEFHVSARVVNGDHPKLYFTNSEGKTCLCVLSKTSGDSNILHVEIGLIRRELRNKLGVNASRDFFTLSYMPCFGSDTH